jgi:short-subunit dehydrogenase
MLSDQNWKAKWICIGGGTSGFGLSLAEEFALRGAKVAIVGRDEERGRAALEKLRQSASEETCFFAVDLANEKVVEDSRWHQWLEEVDISVAVAAAGRSDRGYLASIRSDEFDGLWRANVLSSFNFSRACLGSLRRAGGTLVHVASLAGVVAAPGLAAYPTVKHALVGMSRQWRLELADDGIHVLTFMPGPIQRAESDQGRYDQLVASRQLPDDLKQPAGSKHVRLLDPVKLRQRLIQAIERGERELVIPSKARWLAGLGNLFPSLFAKFLSKR